MNVNPSAPEAVDPATACVPLIRELEANLSQVVLGKPAVIRQVVVALLAGEHVLLEDVPGVGKTLMAKALAKSVDGRFCRIQFTPDLLPSDIVGSSIFNPKTSEFSFSQGPIFAHVVLADEINRTTPRTQSALLEAMSDGQVSADGETYDLPRPFIVVATQNPFEFHGTYPLPESQLDRFLICTRIGYPGREDEMRVLSTHKGGEPVERLRPVLTTDQVLSLQEAVRRVNVDESIQRYLLDIVDATRKSEELHVGVSTRGALALHRACQALALFEGRSYVVPDDVKLLAVPVLAHRVISRNYLQSGYRQQTEALINRITGSIRVPQ